MTTVTHIHESTPSAYVVQRRQQYCIQCARSHSFTSLWSKTKYTGVGNPHRLQPVLRPTDIAWNVPIEYRQDPVERVPFCHDCYTTVILGHLRTPPQPQQSSVIVGFKAAEPKPQVKPKPEKYVYTTDDLL